MANSSNRDPTRRVVNGYGITTSLQSITQLGANEHASASLAQYKAGAIAAEAAVKQKHGPAIRSLHMQKNYPETRRLMQPPYGRLAVAETPRELKDVSFPPTNMHATKWDRHDKPFSETHPERSKQLATDLNWGNGHRKQLLEKAQTTNVNYIIKQKDSSGQPFKAGSDTLFPQHASHMYLLQLTHAACAPDPRIQPGPLPQRPTWGGMHVGWSNHP